MDGTLAEIRMFAGNFSPRGWQMCSGQLLSIAQWTAVFALVGTTYGGDGQTSFGVPDFRGRVAVGTGNGPGLQSVQLGEAGGTNSLTILSNNLPVHTHPISGGVTPKAASDGNLGNDPTNKYVGPGNFYAAGDTANMAPIPSAGLVIAAAGNSQPISLLQPYQGMNYIFCIEGIFPSRD